MGGLTYRKVTDLIKGCQVLLIHGHLLPQSSRCTQSRPPVYARWHSALPHHPIWHRELQVRVRQEFHQWDLIGNLLLC